MKRILCYGDSNTWGVSPENLLSDDRKNDRYDEHTRWAGVMRDQLGSDYFVIEEGLRGRTTVFEDPLMPIRSGSAFFEMVLQTCDPVDCIIFALGTNDTKDMFAASGMVITRGMERLLLVCRNALYQTGSADAKIILACPVIPRADKTGTYWYGFSEESTRKGEELQWRYLELAKQKQCHYININEYALTYGEDGVHLDKDAHYRIGTEMAALVRQVLSE